MRTVVHVTVEGHELDLNRLPQARKGLDITTWRKGDVVGTSHIERRLDGWRLSVTDSNNYDTEPVVAQALSLLKPLLPSVKAYIDTEGLSASIACVVEYEDSTPSISLSRDTLKSLCEAGLEIDFDLYGP